MTIEELANLKLHVSKEAARWYKEEFVIEDEAFLRFFVRYGGIGGQIPGFSLGVHFDTPDQIHASSNIDNITFFIEDKDKWYFDGKDLEIILNKKMKEPEFIYTNH